jgi:hypothetical protein
MANDKYTLDVAINTADAANSIGDIKKSLKELKNIQLEYGEGTEEFTKAAQKAGELKDRLNAVNDSLKNLSNSPVENVKNSFGTLTSQLRTLDFEGAKQSLKDLGASSGVLVKGILGLGPGVNAATVAFRGLGAAIAATGIGALAIAIGVIIQNFDKIKESGGALGDVFTFIGDAINSVKTAMLELLVQFGLVDKAVLEDTESQKEYKKAIDETKKSVDDLTLSLDNEVAVLGKTGAEREKILLDQEIAAKKRELLSINDATLSLQLYTEYQQLASKGIQNLTEQERYRFEEIAKTDYFAIGKKVQEDLDKIDKIRAGKLLEIQKKQSDENAKNAKKAAEERAAAELQTEKDKRAKLFEELGIQSIKVREIKQLDLADEKAGMEEKSTLAMNLDKQTSDNLLKLKGAELEYNRLVAEEEKRNKLNNFLFGLDLAQQSFSILNNLSQLAFNLEMNRAGASDKLKEQAAKRDFNRRKALGIVSATIETARAITEAAPDPIRITFAALTGVSQIAVIASQKFNSGNAGSIAPPVTAPNISPGITPTVTTGQFTGFGEFKPGELENRRVYVVESDITGVQRRIQVIEDRSKY